MAPQRPFPSIRLGAPELAHSGARWKWLLVLALLGAFVASHAQTAPQSAGLKATKPAVDGVSWSSLSSAQKSALRPLEREWDGIDAPRKTKWLEIANRFPTMSAPERARIQGRMEEWAKLGPRERGQARMNFKEAQQVPATERKAKWEAYKALPPDQQKQLAARAAPSSRKSAAADPADATGAKSNEVPNPSYAPRPKAIAPTVAQAQPGATTNLITKRPSPPAHQQTGMPKIAVGSGFVDQSTLLPKRGPQGAATRSAAASGPAAARRP